MTSEPESPFDIPELSEFIGLHLSSSDLFSCTLACKLWNQIFSPILYTRVDILEHCVNPTFPTLSKYSHHIKFLYLSNREYYSLPCSQLISVGVSDTSPMLSDKNRQDIIDLLIRNKSTIVTFSMYTCDNMSSPSLWKALALCNKIKNLRFYSVRVNYSEAPEFWTACSNVNSLTLCNHVFLPCSDKPRHYDMPDQFPGLKIIRLINGLPVNDYEKLLQRCPNLISLLSHSQDLKFSHDQCVALGASKSLKSLRDWEALRSSVSDEFIAAKLNASGSLESLALNDGQFMQNSFRTLMEHHTRTIRKIVLNSRTTITSIHIQGILSRCSLLEEFDSQMIYCIDIARFDLDNLGISENENTILGEDWACLGLKSLKLFFNMSTRDFGKEIHSQKDRVSIQQRQEKLQERHTFRQLSRLTKLETLSFSTTATFGTTENKGLELKLMSRGGELDQLKQLCNLQSIDVSGTMQDMDKRDIDWIILHLPKLKSLKGQLHSDFFQNSELASYFNRYHSSLCA